jgi:hypothetical protein
MQKAPVLVLLNVLALVQVHVLALVLVPGQ